MSDYTKPFVLGLDCGGTKTKAKTALLDGTLLDTFVGDGFNVNSFGAEVSAQNLRSVLEHVKNAAGSLELLKGICVGVAGISNVKTTSVCKDVIREFGITTEPLIVGDFETALYGAHGKGEGIIVISGTGSVCSGIYQHRLFRVGGWGHFVDDEGSGYAIGRDVLSNVVRAEDGREEKTCMRDYVMKAAGVTDFNDLISFIYAPSTGKKGIANLAPIVMKGYESHEAGAERILDKAAAGIAEMVLCAAKRAKVSAPEVAYCGSVLQNNDVIRDKVTRKIQSVYPDAVCILPKEDAAMGAVIECLQFINQKEHKE